MLGIQTVKPIQHLMFSPNLGEWNSISLYAGNLSLSSLSLQPNHFAPPIIFLFPIICVSTSFPPKKNGKSPFPLGFLCSKFGAKVFVVIGSYLEDHPQLESC